MKHVESKVNSTTVQRERAGGGDSKKGGGKGDGMGCQKGGLEGKKKGTGSPSKPKGGEGTGKEFWLSGCHAGRDEGGCAEIQAKAQSCGVFAGGRGAAGAKTGSKKANNTQKKGKGG